MTHYPDYYNTTPQTTFDITMIYEALGTNSHMLMQFLILVTSTHG